MTTGGRGAQGAGSDSRGGGDEAQPSPEFAPGKQSLVAPAHPRPDAVAGAVGKNSLVELLPGRSADDGGLPHEAEVDALMMGQRTGAASPRRARAPGAPARHVPAHGAATTAGGEAPRGPRVTSPTAGINQPGFVDNSKGAPLYTTAAEAGGELVRDTPLAPAAAVFVSGTHPRLKHWWYVTALGDGTMARGYVEDFRINTALPEPFAKLIQLHGGETPERLAKENFSEAVRDGHDLRYYENVLLYVNRGRDGIRGTYQEPNILGKNNDNIKLYRDHRIWVVSPGYAKTLEGIVPSGSFSGGAVAKARRFAQHLEDILHSVTEAPSHFGEVAGELAQAIRDHMPAIIGITGAFLMAEAGSMFLAATPTGVGQAAAAIIQLALSAFGAAGMVEAGIEALKHGTAWLTTAWTAHGKLEAVSEASREFVRMMVAIAIAALNRAGAKTNYRNALKIANNMPTGGLPALATVGGAPAAGAAGAAAAIGPSSGSFVAAGHVMMEANEHGGGGGDKPVDPARELEQIKQRLADGKKLSGKEKQALRARKRELQEELGLSEPEPVSADTPAPTAFKRRAAGLTGKEAATDVPSWIHEWPDARPGIEETGTAFATRMMNKRYGRGKWERTGVQGTEFSQLKKFGDRAFE